MSTIKINCDTISKLTHESLEFRLSTLEEVSSKMQRALQHNATIEFNAGYLCKQLILWFEFVPLQQPLKVLSLLKSLIESKKYGPKAANKVEAAKIIEELRNIQRMFDIESEEFNVIIKIIELLENYLSLKVSNEKPEDLANLVPHSHGMKINSELFQCNNADYETPWSQPCQADYASMKFFSDILINKFSTYVEVENALQHLQVVMEDYPAEYFLQPPHIFCTLLELYERTSSGQHTFYIDKVARVLLQFLITLEKRIKMKRKTISFNTTMRKKENFEKPLQLKIETALTKLFKASIFYLDLQLTNDITVVWQVIFMVVKLLKYLKKNINSLWLFKIASVASNLRLQYPDIKDCAKHRLHQMLIILLLQDVAIDDICNNPLEALEVFEPLLRDFTMKQFFSKRHQQLENFLFKYDSSLREKYEVLNFYEASFDQSIQILKNNTTSNALQIIKKGNLVSSGLDMLQSYKLIDVLFASIIDCIPNYLKNCELKRHVIELLLKLLNLSCISLKVYTYEKLTNSFKRHIGCLMTGECYSFGCSNDSLLKAHIIGIPLNSDLLMRFLDDCFESPSDKIKSLCCKFIELFLKSQNFYGDNWHNLIQIIIPMLPLLNCCNFSENLMELLLKLFDPDLKLLPYICVLQGNVGFLFHSNGTRRSEALTRLTYMLNLLKSAENYMPNLVQISDTLPNDICFGNTAREYRNIFSDRSSAQSDVINNLHNLLHLLESPDVTPVIRKTTLIQINVLCNNWLITAELCYIGASYLILNALENALQQNCQSDYADAAVPIISILNKIMLCDSSFRSELSKTPNIYVLLLRAIMMFHHDIQIRQDTTMCLFQLLFSSHLVSTENFIEGPVALHNIKIPVNITFNSVLCNKTPREEKILKGTFHNTLEENQYWRMAVASYYFDGLKNITQKSPIFLSQLDIRDDLKLTTQDVRFIRATQPNVTLQRLLKSAINATDHISFIQVCQLLKQQLLMFTLKNTFSINNDLCLQLNNIFRRYLQMAPGNVDDINLYEHLLDIATICLQNPVDIIVLNFFEILREDPRNALFVMLTQDEEIPIQIYNKIAVFLKFLISKQKHVFESNLKTTEYSSFYANFFDSVIERGLKFLEMRDLQRVRSLLPLMVAISSCQFLKSDHSLYCYCRRFIKLSSALKSFTQTGAQWHRDCLKAILELYTQMKNPKDNFRPSAGFVKYISGLCAHSDIEVRTLAWTILHVSAKTEAVSCSINTPQCVDNYGTGLLVSELSFLPGGFLACCISTLLDADEAISVRHLSGQLLAVLIRTQGEIEEIKKLLHQHNFIPLAAEELTVSECILELEIPLEKAVSEMNITTCDLISCYTLLCIAVSHREPLFLNELCNKSFMFKLYEVFIKPPPSSKHLEYVTMVGHICRLYTLYNSNNFMFLQRTICRDSLWLECFCQILFGIVLPSNEMYAIVNMLQLFLILCTDLIALKHLLIHLKSYSLSIVKLFQNSLNIKHINTNMQDVCLSILRLLLVKSQPEVGGNLSSHIISLFESENISIESLKSSKTSQNNDNKKPKSHDVGKITVVQIDSSKSSISEQVCMLLTHLFSHQYPAIVCNFATPPNSNQHHVTETLALLLKQFPSATKTALNVDFQYHLVKNFFIFFKDFASVSCTGYKKLDRNNKNLAVIKNLRLLFQLLLSWHSSSAMIITDNILASDYAQIIIRIWPWLTLSNDLKLTVLKLCCFLSERSLIICKHFSILEIISFPHCVLKLVAKMMIAETLKIQANINHSTIISVGLRILMNCCSCLEGRTLLNKIDILDVFDNINPFTPKAPQLKMDIDIAWLKFWKLYSRYDEGAQSRHLKSLCFLVNKSSAGACKRLMSLHILRNMAFVKSNRSTLITSTDFLYTINQIVSLQIKNSVEEQFIMCVALWKLITGGVKFAALIRGTELEKNLQLLKENLIYRNDGNDDTIKFSNDLLHVLDIIFMILY